MIGPTLADLPPEQPMWTVTPDYAPLLKYIEEIKARVRADALREAVAKVRSLTMPHSLEQVADEIERLIEQPAEGREEGGDVQ